jgi:hypothetical protein
MPQLGTMVHKLMHMLGFIHEQSHPDRDEYVIIARENIEDRVLDQFSKYSFEAIDQLGLPFDYPSIVHYTPYFYSRNTEIGSRPIAALRTGGVKMGKRQGFGEGHIQKINRYYGCTEDSIKRNVPASSTQSPSAEQWKDKNCFDDT